MATTEGTTQKTIEKRRISQTDLTRYDPTLVYIYTEKDGLNRITVLKELGKEVYFVAGRYATFQSDSRLYVPLTEKEKVEVEKLLRMGRKNAAISFL